MRRGQLGREEVKRKKLEIRAREEAKRLQNQQPTDRAKEGKKITKPTTY